MFRPAEYKAVDSSSTKKDDSIIVSNENARLVSFKAKLLDDSF